MESQIAKDIRRYLELYLNGEIELCSFEDFFVPMLWDIDERNDSEATQLAGKIHILTAEYSRGDRSAKSLRQELANTIRPVGLEISPDSNAGARYEKLLIAKRFYVRRSSIDISVTDRSTRIPRPNPVWLSGESSYRTPLIGEELQAVA